MATDLAANTTYSFSVKAYDAAGNYSNASTALSVTTNSAPDTTPPSAPTNLTSPSKTTTSVSLSWSASTDNTGVTGYKIYKDGIEVGTAVGTTYTVSGLTASTAYSFTVKAYDAAGNYSNASTALSVTTNSNVPNNNAPLVYAGGDNSANINQNINTYASVSDPDGPAPLTYQWTKVSGPGTVTFSAPTSVNTKLSFSLTGIYLIRLTATDGAGASGYDEVLQVISNPGN